MHRPAFLTAILLLLISLVAVALTAEPPTAEQKPASAAGQPDAKAIERSRKLVQTLDNVYKQTIVLITDKYVHDEDDFAAGSAAVKLFTEISRGGSHQVRLLDATGEPYEPKNVANDDFEREGVKRLKAGKPYYDEVVEQDGGYRLRAITPVPVVMKKCVMCHANYADVKPGMPIGAISYTVPIE